MARQNKRHTRAAKQGTDSLGSIDLVDDSSEWRAPPTPASTTGTRSRTAAKTASVQTKIQTKPQAATSPPPPKRAKPSAVTTTNKSKDIMSDPRLETFMEKARYEAFVDPYRGMFPFFSITFNPINNHHHLINGAAKSNTSENNSGSNDTNNDASLHPGQDVWIDCRDPAVIVSIEDDHAIVKWSINNKEDRIELDKITIVEAGKTRSGRPVASSNANTSSNAVRRNELELNLEKPSPWMNCSNVLTEEWEYGNLQGVEVVNLYGEEDDNPPKDILVTTKCPTINIWAQDERDNLQKERAAALKTKKKGKKKRKKEEDDVVVVDGSGDEMEEGVKKECEVAKVICGRRDGDGECACDYNPFCLGSLGGIFDEYRYNVAKTKHMLLERSKSAPSEKEFTKLLRENWSELPVKKTKKGAEQNDDSKNRIRGSITVSKESVQMHMATNIFCSSNHGNNETTVEHCMEMLQNHHTSLIIPSMQMHLSKDNNNIQLSKPSGLRNLGATCYLNSQLQCLAQNLGFVHGLLSWKPTMPASTDTRTRSSAERMNNVLLSMQSILARMRYGPQSIICTNDFSVALGLENDEMQDPNEFAGLLFDKMQDSFKQCATISGQTELDNLLPSIYWGKSSIETRCSECGYISKRTDDFKFLPIPIVECEDESSQSRGNGISNDVDVQQLLDISLHPESMDGDNQYFCSSCDKKCDATRSPKFENLPPVLNLQLNRYVFDMQTFSKQKLSTKVLLPQLLEVPLGDNDIIKTYSLVAVQYHLGTSAHGGHYVANALDWNTGVWFEFNDEDVEVLEDGPLSAFQPESSKGKYGDENRRKISGSADAYNLLYVEKSYLSSQSLSDLERCLKGNPASSSTDSCDIYQEHTRIRQEQYRLEQESQDKKSREQSRIEFRKTRIKDEILLFPSNMPVFKQPQDFDHSVLVDATVLRRLMSCTDGLLDIFEGATEHTILDTKSLLCEHGAVGIHPRRAARLKLLPKETFDVLGNIIQRELEMYWTHEAPTKLTEIQGVAVSNPMLEVAENAKCDECSPPYQLEIREKLITLEKLIEVHAELRAGVNDLDVVQETPGDVRAISRSFVTAFRKYVESAVKSLLAGPNEKSTMPPGGDLHTLDLSGILSHGDVTDGKAASEKESASGEVDGLDFTVNSKITCDHGYCNVMHARRSTRLIPKILWTKIQGIFPKAICHIYEMPSDHSVGNCGECYIEKDAEDRFPLRLNEWKSNIKQTPTLLAIIQNQYNPSTDKGNNFRIIHRDEVQAWRDAYSYLQKSKKNVSNNTVRDKLLQLCPSSLSSLICKEHGKSIGLPSFSQNGISIGSLAECNLEVFAEEDFDILTESITFLASTIQENGSTQAAESIKATVMQDGEDLYLIHFEPELCGGGCTLVSCTKETDTLDAQAEPKSNAGEEHNANPENEKDTQFTLCVHEIEAGNDLEVVASTILADIASELSDDLPLQRRSRRKKKGPGNFPSHTLKVPSDCNIAHLRLLVHQKTGKRLTRQCFHLVVESLSESQCGVQELSDKDNSKDFCEFVMGGTDTVHHILMSYKDADSGDGQDSNRASTRSKRSKVDVEMEEGIMTALTESAFRGFKSDEYPVGKARKAKKRREERGFRGTFLQSSPSDFAAAAGVNDQTSNEGTGSNDSIPSIRPASPDEDNTVSTQLELTAL